MNSNQVRHAVLLVLNTHKGNSGYDAVYGGETLLNRSLVALSKSGVQNVMILTPTGYKEKLDRMIQKVQHRLLLNYEVKELGAGQIISDKIKEISSAWHDPFLLFEADKFIHPTFLNQAVSIHDSAKPILWAYQDVLIKDRQLHFDASFKEKFKIIFANPGGYHKIVFDNTEPSLFRSGFVELSEQNRIAAFSDDGDGLFSTDVLVCRRENLNSISNFRSCNEAIQEFIKAQRLALRFVKEGWWMRITPEISKSHIKELIWKIAFKEISGEFSKAVNSKMSKPLSFYFARKGVTPNTLSNAQLVLFFIASCFLLIDAHWAMIVFAVLWQFSAGVLDRCDGEVARIRNHESEAGGRFDMIIDDMRFGLPFIFLAAALYFQTQETLYLAAFSLAFIWFIALTLYEQDFMRKAGYTSRQVMYVDYLKLQGEKSQRTSIMKKYVPLIKGDIRTFYVSLLALFGLKVWVFWVLLIYLTLVPVTSFVGILRFKRERKKTL